MSATVHDNTFSLDLLKFKEDVFTTCLSVQQGVQMLNMRSLFHASSKPLLTFHKNACPDTDTARKLSFFLRTVSLRTPFRIHIIFQQQFSVYTCCQHCMSVERFVVVVVIVLGNFTRKLENLP